MADEMFKKLVFLQCSIFCFYPLLCITLITTASIFQTTIAYYAGFTNVNFNIVPALLISAGCIGFLMLLTRCCFDKKLTYAEVIWYGVFPIVLILQIIAAIYGCVQSADRSHYLQKAMERDMENMFSHYYINDDIKERFNSIQNELECCGVYGYKDYANNNLPKSCCPANYIGTYCADNKVRYNSGCASKVLEQIIFNLGVLSYIACGLIGLQIIIAMVVGGIILTHFRQRIERGYLAIDG